MRCVLHPASPPGGGPLEITADVVQAVQRSRVRQGIASLHACGDSTALLVRDGGDEETAQALVKGLDAIVSGGQDDGSAISGRLKAALLGRQVTIPVVTGRLGPGGRCRIVLIDFGDGGGQVDVVCTLIADTGIPQNVP